MLARRLSAPSMAFISTALTMPESKLSTPRALVLTARQSFYRRRMVSWGLHFLNEKLQVSAAGHFHPFTPINVFDIYWHFPLSVTLQAPSCVISLGCKSLGSN